MGALAGLVAVALLGGCAGDTPSFTSSGPKIEVDTPELRAAKAEIGMEDCVPGTGGPVDGGLPEVTLECLGGGTEVDLSSLRGPMVLNFWQGFCAPCRIEMPALQEFHETYGDQVPILGIDFNDVHPAAALKLAAETGVTYPSLADPGGELMTERVFERKLVGMPAFAFVDADGVVSEVQMGGVESMDEVVDLVREHLDVTLELPAR